MTSIDWTPSGGGVTSEVGRLRTVLVHRPGRELERLNPRNAADLLFDGMPWVVKAQREHDAFTDALRAQDVNVVYLADLLRETLAIDEAKDKAIESAVDAHVTTRGLYRYVLEMLEDLSPDALAEVLMAGLRSDEVVGHRRNLLTALEVPEHFVIRPLPNLFFTRDSSAWIGHQPAVTSLFKDARKRENRITELIYGYHPAFKGHRPVHGWRQPNVEGGDILVLSDKAIAIGVSERTTPAGAEALARTAINDLGIEKVVLVPLERQRSMMHLDTVCTWLDRDAITIYPNIAKTMTGVIISADGDHLKVEESLPFAQAAAKVLEIDEVRVIGADMDPHTAEREQWDDGNNTLAVSPGVVICYERNTETNARLEDAGITVITIDASELGSGRGGPRCMSCPIDRDPLD